MISQRTALATAEVYIAAFTRQVRPDTELGRVLQRQIGGSNLRVDSTGLRDYLFSRSYEPWLYHKAQALIGQPLVLKNLLIGLYDGTALADVMPNHSWENRQILGRQYLFALARDILNARADRYDAAMEPSLDQMNYLRRCLELDGYSYQDRNLVYSESNVLDTQEESGTLMRLFDTLSLGNREATRKALTLAQEHYLAGRWEDTISNGRKVFESILREVAIVHSERCLGVPWPDKDAHTEPAKIREYLKNKGLLVSKEKEAIAALYQLLGEKGSHPAIAQKDQAQLLLHLALVLSQFVMVRLQGILGGKSLGS